ncbi:MAG: hypothetical protein Q7S38_01515 [bacterium]|nr:hypothetical protein [bacterium]
MNKITAWKLPNRKKSQKTREALAVENYNSAVVIKENIHILKKLSITPFSIIGQCLSGGISLNFEQAFLGMTFVVASTNKSLFDNLKNLIKQGHEISSIKQYQLLGPAQTFLTTMAIRARLNLLTPEEIAGMVAAGTMDVNTKLKFNPYVLEIGGMGGDKGFKINKKNKKVINASTLSALVLSSLGIPVLKHGGHRNTSPFGAVETIESLGVNIYQSSTRSIQELVKKTHFYFSATQVAKTFHDISQGPFGGYETITHLVGPMTPPIHKNTVFHKIFGMNGSVNPVHVAKAFEILNKKGYFKIGNIIILNGLDRFINKKKIPDPIMLMEHTILDEVSPFSTFLAIVQKGIYKGSFVLNPSDFGIQIDNKVFIKNKKEELSLANKKAITGSVVHLRKYLAMNAALGLFAAKYLDKPDAIIGKSIINKQYLKECYKICDIAIKTGKASRHLERIKKVSQKSL